MKMSQSGKTTSIFYEEQQFRQPLIWILLLIIGTCAVVIFAHGLYTQLYLGQPWGDRPMSDAALIFSSILTLAITIGTGLLFYKLKLIVKVDTKGIYIRFYPLAHKHIPYESVRTCKTRTYNPLIEYGGWGIRFSSKGKAYNVSGNEGVQLELTQSSPLLIGSQRADELASVINTHLSLATASRDCEAHA